MPFTDDELKELEDDLGGCQKWSAPPINVMGMQHSIVAALNEYEAKLSAEIKEGVERAMSRNNIVALVEAETLAIIRNEVLSAIKYEAHKQLAPIVEGVVQAQIAKEAKRIWE